jgi:glycosyltransferase involved in cell wall biosynthesis
MEVVQGETLMTPIKVSVVLPVFNEAGLLGNALPELYQQMELMRENFEIIVVDDGSNDGSSEELFKLQKTFPSLRVIHHTRNRGNGAALRTGIRNARGEIVVCMDADGQHQPKDIPKLLAKIPPNDMVVGARTKTYEGAWYRNLANRFYNSFASWLTQYPVLDLTSGFRAMRRSAALHFLPLFPSGFSAPTTSTLAFLKAGYTVDYEPVEVLPRKHGKSKIRPWRDGQRFIIIILRMVTLYDPMRIFLPVTFSLGLLGIVSWILGMVIAGRWVVPGSTVVLFVTAVQTLLLGLVSNQIANFAIPYYGDEYIEEINGEQPLDGTEDREQVA